MMPPEVMIGAAVIHDIATDESLQVLLFIMLPLSLLVLGFLVYAAFRPNPFVATFPTFSVRVESVGREEAYVRYREKGRKELVLVSQTARNRVIYVPIPQDLSGDDLCDVVQNLALGLAKLRYQYLIYRTLKPTVVPKEEREAAIAELQRMGVEISADSGLVQRATVPNWRSTVGQDPKILLPRVFSLMDKARGLQENWEILAQTDMMRKKG